MENPSMDTIYQAISALYDISNSAEKEKASLWLGDIQKSIQSWKIADDLLQQRKTMYSCYFAAQTMRSKVQNNLLELSEESIVSLRDSLVAHLKATSPDTDTAPILTQLCLALADLALQMPSWHNCVNDLINLFSNNNDFALLEILTVLPQEIDSTHLKLGENRRADIKNELRANSSLVTLFLKESLTNSQNTHVALRIVKCMTSWIQVDAVDLQEVPHNAVIGYCLQVLRDHNSINTVHDAASDCICSLLHCFETNNNDDAMQKLLFDNIASLEESYHMAVAHEEEEKAANYARVFTILAETFLEKIIACMASGNTHFAMRSLDLALVCVGHHDYEVAEITFNLWYRLSEDVYQRDYQPLTDAFKPHIERLIEALARHCQCEPDLTQLPDEGDDFFEFRIKVMGLIKDVVFIVGSSSVFRQMFASLQADMSWEQTEAALFVMQAVAKNIIPEEYEYVPKVVEAILSMPAMTHLAVRKTCILLLGELCEWIERHPECLKPCLDCLIEALNHPHLAYAAAIALQNVCRVCGAGAGAVARLQAAARGPLAAPAAAALMRALAAAVSALPPHQVTDAMREAAAGPLAALRAGSEPAAALDRLAALFREVQPATAPLLCLPAMADAWPVIDDVLDKHAESSRVCERACRCVRFMARCAGRELAPLAGPLAARLATLYRARAHSCVLYLAGVLLDELHDQPPAAAALLALLQDVLPRAFELLHRPDGLRDNPDTVDDLFRLCIRFLQHIPREFLSSGAASALLPCAALAATLDHRDANSSVMKFIYDFAKLANTSRTEMQDLKDMAESALQTYASELAYGLVSAAALHLHAYMLEELGDALLQLVMWARVRRPELLRGALARLQQEARTRPTDLQCANFHQYAISAEKSKEITRLLRDFAKLYR